MPPTNHQARNKALLGKESIGTAFQCLQVHSPFTRETFLTSVIRIQFLAYEIMGIWESPIVIFCSQGFWTSEPLNISEIKIIAVSKTTPQHPIIRQPLGPSFGCPVGQIRTELGARKSETQKWEIWEIIAVTAASVTNIYAAPGTEPIILGELSPSILGTSPRKPRPWVGRSPAWGPGATALEPGSAPTRPRALGLAAHPLDLTPLTCKTKGGLDDLKRLP